LAQDVSAQVGKVEPTRDWFPISFVSTFAGFSDMVKGQDFAMGFALLRLPPGIAEWARR